MKVLVFSLALAVAVATINADCLHCSNNKEDYQEIKYEDLRSSENGSWEQKYTTESSNVVQQFRIIQKFIQNYPMYAEEAKQAPKFADPLNLVDSTEFLANGEIEYKNAIFSGLENSVLKDVSFNEIGQNLFSVYAVLAKAEVTGDYVATNGSKKESGQFYMTLKNIEFRTKFNMNHFMGIQHEINANKAVTFSDHETAYTNEEVLNALENDNNADVQKPYAYYNDYLNGVIKSRIANEMTVSFMPLIAQRLEQTLRACVMFQTNEIQVPKSYAHIAPGIQAQINHVLLQDMRNTDQIQKLTNYTVDGDQTEMLFSFTAFDLRGSNKWQLKYSSTGNVYTGESVFAVDNVQTVISVIKFNGNGTTKVKFVKTTVNGLTLMLGTENNCESIRNFVQQRVPHVLEETLKTYFNEQFKTVLRNQILLVGEQTQ